MEPRLTFICAPLLLAVSVVICAPDEITQNAGLAVTNYTANSVTVQWEQPGTVKLCWQQLPPGDTAPTCEHPPPGQMNYTLRLDNACQDHTITLTPADGPALSLEFSATKNGPGPGTPRSFKGLRYPGGVVLFEWFPPPPPSNYCITRYSLQVTGGDFAADNLPAWATSREVRDLPVCTGLNVSLTAFGTAGRSSPPAFFHLQPYETAPGAVKDLVVSRSRSHGLHLNWRKPERADCLKEYSVCWRLPEQSNETCLRLAPTEEDFLSFEVSHLRHCFEYLVRVISVGAGQLQGISPVLSHATGPDPVMKLTVDETNAHQATVSWQAPHCAVLYSVCWGSWSSRGTHYCLNTTATSATITELQGIDQGNNYTIIVVAISPNGGTSDNGIITLQKPSPVENFKVLSCRSDAITVTWNLPERTRVVVDQVEVCWTILGTDSSGENCTHVAPSEVLYGINDLQPCTWYMVSATSVHADGAKSDLRNITQFTKADNYTSVGGLEGMEAVLSGEDMTVRWALLEGCVSHVKVCWGVVDGNYSACSTVRSHQSSMTLEKLQLCSNYSITGTALSPDGTQLNSTTLYEFSAVGLPRNITAVVVAPEKVSVTWLPPLPGEDCVASYMLEGESLPPNVTEYMLTGNTPCSYFMSFILVFSTGSITPRDVIIYTSSGLSAPGKVNDLIGFAAGSRSIKVEWKKPEEFLNCLKKYYVCWTQANETTEQCDSIMPMLYPRYTISGLEPCTVYTISVTSVGGNATGETISIDKYTGPKPVVELEVWQAGPQKVLLEWSGTSCDSLYSVCWGAWDGMGSHNCMNVSDTKAMVFGLRDLGSGGRYTVIVKAIGRAGSVSSSVVVVLENSCSVSNLSVTNHTSKSALLSWDMDEACRGRVNRFEVCWDVVSYSLRECTHVPSESSSFELLHLKPCKWYNVTVTAVYVDGVRSESRDVLQYIDVESKRDPDPVSLEETDAKGRNIALKWDINDDMDSCVEYTTLCWTSSRDPTKLSCEKIPSYKENFVIEDVMLCSTYNFSVSVLTADHRQSTEETTSVQLGPGPARNVVGRSPSPGTLLMTWEPPLPEEDCVDHYDIINSPWSDPISGNISADVTEYLLTDQPLCSFVYIWVQAFSADGVPSSQSLLYAYAGMGAPGEIRNLTAVSVGSHSIHLQWSTPATYYRCLKKYSICWKEKSEANETCSTEKVVQYPQHSILGLKSCTEYHVNVSSQGEAIHGNASQLLVTTGPEPVSQLMVAAGSGPVYVTWEASLCAQYYFVCWGTWEGRGNHSCLTTSATSATIADLEDTPPEDKYTVIVRAIGDAGSTSSPYVMPVVRRLLELTLKEVNPTNGTVGWDYSSDEGQLFDHIDVCVTLEASGHRECQLVNASDDEVVLPGLQPCSGYQLHANASGADGEILATTSLEFFTGQVDEEDFDTENKVLGLTVTNITSTAIYFKWDGLAHKQCIRKYVMDLDFFGSSISEENIPNNTYSFAAEGAPPCTLLYISIYAVLPDGSHTAKSVVKTDTGIQAPGKVENIEVFHTTSTSINIQWEPPSDENVCLVRYLVCWQAEESQDKNCSEQIQTAFNSYSIVGLQPCTIYNISVAGLGSDKDIGNATYIVSSTGPEPVRALKASTHKPQEVTLNWEATACAQTYLVCWGTWTGMGVHSCANTSLTNVTLNLQEAEAYSVNVEAAIENGQLSDKSVLVWNSTAVSTSLLGHVSSVVNNTVGTAVDATRNVLGSIGL